MNDDYKYNPESIDWTITIDTSLWVETEDECTLRKYRNGDITESEAFLELL